MLVLGSVVSCLESAEGISVVRRESLCLLCDLNRFLCRTARQGRQTIVLNIQRAYQVVRDFVIGSECRKPIVYTETKRIKVKSIGITKHHKGAQNR